MATDIAVGYVPVKKIRFHPHNVRHDLGDLRALVRSIKRFGVLEPVLLEKVGGGYFQLRAGHRRVVATQMAGLDRVPALIHSEMLEEDEWLIQSVQENVMRRGIDVQERRRTIFALRDLGCTWDGIAEAFGVRVATVRNWCADPAEKKRKNVRTGGARIQQRAVRDFISSWREAADGRDGVTVEEVLAALEDLLDTDRARKLATLRADEAA